MSALGQKQTLALQKRRVCFTPKSGHLQCTSACPLWANSGLNPLQGHCYLAARAHGGKIPTRSEDASMKLALIALGLLATTGVVYAACMLCP